MWTVALAKVDTVSCHPIKTLFKSTFKRVSISKNKKCEHRKMQPGLQTSKLRSKVCTYSQIL